MASAPQIFGFPLSGYIRDRIVEENRGYSSLCWIWRLCPKDDGYAVGKPPGYDKTVRIARVAYETFVGPILVGLEIDHLCHQRGCCNPDHLEPVTHAENMARQVAARKSCRRGHPFEAGNLYIFPNGVRTCRACKTERERSRAPRKAAAA